MCDKAHYEKLETRVSDLEKSSAVLDERFSALLTSTENLRKSMSLFAFAFVAPITLILLLAVVYGALGPRGFNAVTREAKSISQTQMEATK